MPFDNDELTYDAPPPAEDELTFDEPPKPVAKTAVPKPAAPAKPADSTEDMSFLQKVDAAAARGVQGIGSAAGLFARRMGLIRREDDVAAAKNFLGRDLSPEEKQLVQTNGLDALVAPVQTAQNKGISNRVANAVGGFIPAAPALLAGGPVGGALAFGAQAAGGEQQASAAAGEDPEIQAARAKLAFAINAPAAFIPGSTLGLTKVPAQVAAKALTGAAVGSGTSALNDIVQQRPVDPDAAITNAILMGLMSGAHQALATPKAAAEAGAKWSELTGKTFETPEAAVADLQRFTRKVEAAQAPQPTTSERGPVLETKQSRTAYELFKQDLAEQEAAKQRAGQELAGVPQAAGAAAQRPAPLNEPTAPSAQKNELPQGQSFKTAKGSVYTVLEDGSTIRDKAARPEHPGDQGVKPPSQRTVYVDEQTAAALAPPQSGWHLYEHPDGSWSVLTEGPGGVVGAAPSQRGLQVSQVPKVGLLPVELWGHSEKGYNSVHFGNPIVEVTSPKPSVPETTPAAQRPGAEPAPRQILTSLNSKRTSMLVPTGSKASIDSLRNSLIENEYGPDGYAEYQRQRAIAESRPGELEGVDAAIKVRKMEQGISKKQTQQPEWVLRSEAHNRYNRYLEAIKSAKSAEQVESIVRRLRVNESDGSGNTFGDAAALAQADARIRELNIGKQSKSTTPAETAAAMDAASDPLTFDTRHAELFHQGGPTAGTQLSLSELSALTPDQFAARYGDMSRPDFVPPQAESIRLGNEATTPAQIAELKRLADRHTAAVEVSRAEALASGDPERIQQQLALDLHADLFRKAYEHATGPERGLSPEQVIAAEESSRNAVPERSTTPTDVGQAPADRQTVGEGVPGAGREVAPDAQGRGVPAQALRAAGPAEVSAPVEPAGGGVTPPKPPRSGPPELGEPAGGPPRPPEWTPPVPADKWGQMTAHVRRLYRENIRDTGKAFVNAFSRATRMEGFKKTVQGRDLIDRFNKAAVSEQRSVGELSEILANAEKGLNAKELRYLRDGEGAAAYQRGGVEAMPTPALKRFAAAWAEIAHRAAARTEALGVEIADQRVPGGFRPFREGNVPNYFPREGTKAFRDAMQRGKGEVYDAVVEMLQRKDIPLASLESLLDVDASGARRSGNIESPRLGEIEPVVVTKSGERVKILNTNWQTAAEKYIQSVSRRLSIIENFGDVKEDGTWVSGQKAAENIVDGAVKALDGLGRKAEARVAADMWSALNGTQNQAALKWLRANKLETPIATGEAIARTAMLTGATPSQFATGWVPIATRFGTAGTAKSVARQMASAVGLDPKTSFEQHIRENTGVLAQDLAKENLSTKGLLKIGREAGATAKDTLGHTYTTEDIAGSAQKASNAVLSAVGFNASNRFLNSVSVLASAENLANSIQIIREGKTGAVRKLWGMDAEGAAKGLRDNFDFTQADIDRMADTGVTKNDLAQAMQRGTSKANLFRETVFERPPWMNAVLARKMMAYTSYARAMGNTLSDALSAAKSGNVRPIATLLVGGTVGGAALKEFKDLLFRKPDQPDKDALDTAARLLEYQMNASIYGLAGSYGQTVGYGIKRGDFSGPGSAMLDWWLKNAAGAAKSVKEGSLQPSYEAFARTTPIVKSADAWLGGPLSQKKGGPAVQEMQQKARDFKATLPGRGPDDPKFKDFIEALKKNDRTAARAAVTSLRRNGGPEAIRRSLDDYANYTFTGSKETEAKFLRTLTPQQRATYDALLRARRDIARQGQAMVR